MFIALKSAFAWTEYSSFREEDQTCVPKNEVGPAQDYTTSK